MRNLTWLLVVLFLLTPVWGQSVSPAPEFENQFKRSQGWTGADGTYSIPMGGDRTLWCFSDTFFGPVEQGRRVNFKMVNNSFVYQEGAQLAFLEAPIFRPPNKRGWFWLWDGVYSQGEFEILLGQFEKVGEGMWGFAQTGLWHARFNLDLADKRARVIEYKRLPYSGKRGDEQITFGTSIYEDPVWTYIYGTRDKGFARSYVLARAPRGRLGEIGVWRFYDGKTWNRNMWSAKGLFLKASMESSVHRTQDDQFLYVGCVDREGDVVYRIAPRPEGPWSEAKLIKKTPEHKGNIFTYNAKAHPRLSQNGRLLISYNVNTQDVQQVVDDADIYRPRFFWWTPPEEGWLPLNP